ncbi:hypothetical protein [Dactylosporangium sp. NPDC049140]|uniref:hypothetical protein n=1 Tax=Dactylosporangium sp. NPDC049140 TaxID=3155647 RepID=UPI0033D7309B
MTVLAGVLVAAPMRAALVPAARPGAARTLSAAPVLGVAPGRVWDLGPLGRAWRVATVVGPLGRVWGLVTLGRGWGVASVVGPLGRVWGLVTLGRGWGVATVVGPLGRAWCVATVGAALGRVSGVATVVGRLGRVRGLATVLVGAAPGRGWASGPSPSARCARRRCSASRPGAGEAS